MTSCVIDRLRNNLIFEDSLEAKEKAVGMLCIPFKDEDQTGVQELFDALKVLTERYEAARAGLAEIIAHQQRVAGTENVIGVCTSIAKRALENSEL